MIELKRQETGISMSVDAGGAAVLADAFREALAGGRARLEVLFDFSVLTMKRAASSQSTHVEVALGDVAEPAFSRSPDGVSWILGHEDLESGIASLQAALNKRAFVPAEFLRVKVPKNKKLDYIFAEFQSGGERERGHS